MAVSQILITPDASRDAKARVLAPQVGSWPRFVLKQAWGSFEAGTEFRRATGSKGERYLVNAVACQCPDYANRGNVCKHIRAYVQWEAREATLAQLYPRCADCGARSEMRVCDDCAATRERQDRLAAARRRVMAEV